MHGYDNDGAWLRSLTSLFDGIAVRDCTPDAILNTMANMPRSSNRLEDITISARDTEYSGK